MLHVVPRPDCADQLDVLMDMQCAALGAFANFHASLVWDEDYLKQAMGDADWGKWLWARYSGNQDWKKAIQSLLDACSQFPEEAQDLVSAFIHDRDFANHLDDASFRMEYAKFNKDMKKAIHDFMVLFYDQLDENKGFREDTHKKKKFVLTRSNILPEGVKICYICDARRDLKRQGKSPLDLDHFYPKADWPFFSLHYMNLVPTCPECNRDFKFMASPIPNGDLTECFYSHSGYTVIEQADISVFRISHKYYVALKNKSNAYNKRIQSINVYHLGQRWAETINDVSHQRVIELLQSHSLKLRKQKKIPDRASFEDDLNLIIETAEEIKRHYGKRENQVVYFSYLQFARTNQAERDVLFDAYLAT